jgi:glycosyltransferase involved in cell wall biosynthesis
MNDMTDMIDMTDIKCKKIIFILHNIYETTNGVSNKYIKFINYILNNSETNTYKIVLFSSFKKKKIYNDLIKNKHNNLSIIKLKGLNVPFYKEIKIPIINEKKILREIQTGNEIIIFNGEFIWMYTILNNIRNKHKKIKIFPNMHTDYVFYLNNIYKNNYLINFSSTLNYLNNYLETKIFDGIIVTGQNMKERYSDYTETIFNANEVDLDIFNNIKIDSYDKEFYNIIYCGRLSKEKNIEEVLDCCLNISDKYNYILNIIGDGPYLDNLKNIIDLEYEKIKNKIIFYGNKTQKEINSIYKNLDNRIFIFTSISETFGKTPMEAGATGIPIFIKKSEITDYLYINKKNAYIFDDKNTFSELFDYFINLNNLEKQLFISNSIKNIKKYDQNEIFSDWIDFLINGNKNKNKNKNKINFFEMFSFHGLSSLINCSGNILGD